ncbi:EmrB/QacA subfamily drug resistance transporter [Streptacidiphilus sp. MAP12-16]|uniref:MFS transporter n=1 Tax=Streptacidiphilus sp. MAP12-16 TaxID=3156300 RepID=UPI003512A7FB
MAVPAGPGARSKRLVLAAMIFAVAMTFIDQTIVSIAVPQIQRELGLSSTGVQWAVNAYLLALAALFAFGGRLADTVGHRKMVLIGVIVFAGASALCGLTPKGAAAEAWIVAFRALQGAGGAIMFPAALAIVVQTYPLRERGRALALFFGIAGGLTAVGPILGGYLTQWTWRAIFWVNIPIALIALVLIVVSKPVTEHRPAPMDYRGLALIASGVGLSVFGFQQALLWGWSNPGIGMCIGAGILLLVVFCFVERGTPSPLIQVSIFRVRPFLVENVVLFVTMLVFVPVFFFASEYAQIALGKTASQAGLYLLYFFLGFVVAAQIGGRMLDRGGAKRPVVLGCVLSAVGFFMWAGQVTKLEFSSQQWYVVLAGAGMGFMLGPASTDAINRASRLSYGEATGITQTVRNYAASLGLAILGTIQVAQFRSRLTTSLVAQGMPHAQAAALAGNASQSQSGGGGSLASIPAFVRLDFAYATRTVLFAMAGIMAVGAIVAMLGLTRGLQAEPAEAGADGAEAPVGGDESAQH